MYKNTVLVDFVKSKLNVNTAYMWGEFGRQITNSTISQKAAQYPSYYSTSRQNLLKSYVGKNYYGCDCVGLYKWFIWTDGGTKTSITYSSSTDRNASGMYNAAKEKGDINTIPEIPGLILYMSGHVGVYIGNGEVVECTLSSFGDGVVKTKLSDRKWLSWCKMPEIDYTTTSSSNSNNNTSSSSGAQKFKIGDKVIINGPLYTNSNAASAAGSVKNKTTNITRYVAGAKHPYNTTGDLGWMDESSIKAYSGSSSSSSPSSSNTTTMTVQPSVGLWLQSSNKAWNASTRIVCMPKGAKVTVYNGTESKLGSYTSVKVTYNGTTGYCAKDYLK